MFIQFFKRSHGTNRTAEHSVPENLSTEALGNTKAGVTLSSMKAGDGREGRGIAMHL